MIPAPLRSPPPCAPPLPAGLVDVTVVNANGEDTLPNGFLYYGAGGVSSAKLEDAADGTTRAVVTPAGEAAQRWVWPDLLRGRAAWRKVDAD